ncbi:phosphatase PAP2 family protein [Pseudotabrizicola alkalilacus]|nr:phosphatase PAP2 family protein [Pseudotabrizicola alkalilacus]
MTQALPGYLPKAPHIALHHGIGRAQILIARLTILISFVFMAFPAIDLAVTRRVAEGAVFVLAEQPFLNGLRQVGLKGPFIVILAMLLLLGLRTVLPGRHRICAPHKPIFVVTSFVAGQLVVEILKPLIGRARPRNLLEFGGTADFTPVWQFSGQCADNCSFPSGEAAAAAAGLSLLVLFPERLRLTAAIILTPMLMMIAVNRVLFGAHFLSDVVIAWLLTLLAMTSIWKWTGQHARDTGAPANGSIGETRPARTRHLVPSAKRAPSRSALLQGRGRPFVPAAGAALPATGQGLGSDSPAADVEENIFYQ